MKTYFAYTRVSTVKQGVHGVSLQEQRSAIEIYAARHDLKITEWFEEQQTAAKTGRAVFSVIMKRLRKGEAHGLIIHKIDRSARNLKDWAALGELIDTGIDVQVASESYDLASRGGRLTADIQAVIAADYIRNLREETRKGLYGRLKQGLYPFKAPLGYQNNGGGKLKTIDPIAGPLVRRAFELYDTGHYGLRALNDKMFALGLRSHNGGCAGRNGISRVLNEPFYHGVMRIKVSGDTYPGKHERLISKELFDRVQARLAGKYRTKTLKHDFAFRRTFRCAECGYSLIGEIQKGHIYYRCHTPSCPVTAIREEQLVAAIDQRLSVFSDSGALLRALQEGLDSNESSDALDTKTITQSLRLQLDNAKSRRERLLDAYIDSKIDEAQFEDRNGAVGEEIKRLEQNLAGIGQARSSVAKFLELANGLISSYEIAPDEFRGQFLKTVTSNPTVSTEGVDIPIDLPWMMFTSGQTVPQCGLSRDTPRTACDLEHPSPEELLTTLVTHFASGDFKLGGFSFAAAQSVVELRDETI